MPKAEFIEKACGECTTALKLKSTELTLLLNACVEAAEFRREHSKPHAEKYEAMAEQLSGLSDKLDRTIGLRAKWLEMSSSKHKR